MDDKEFKAAFSYALKRLSAQNYLSNDLRRKLKDKEFSSEAIEKVISKCQDSGYLNDSKWVESFINYQFTRKKGPLWILQKLMSKGIKQQEARKRIQELTSESNLENSIQTLLETRYKNKNLRDPKEKQKVVASLMRRGFSLDAILKAFLPQNLV